jgi:hypothetical protein
MVKMEQNCIIILRVCLVRFQIHYESETFQFLSRNDSRSNQNHLVKLFGPFVETFQNQWKWEGSESESLKTPILPFHCCSTKTWNVSNRFTSETFRFFPVRNCSKWFKPESETFHLTKRGLRTACLLYIHSCKLKLLAFITGSNNDKTATNLLSITSY